MKLLFCIVDELDTWSRGLNSDFTLKDYLFGGVMLVKTANPDRYLNSSTVLDAICVQ